MGTATTTPVLRVAEASAPSAHAEPNRPVRAEERDGSKVRLAMDAVRMLREMGKVRGAAAAGLYDVEPVLPEAGDADAEPGPVSPPTAL